MSSTGTRLPAPGSTPPSADASLAAFFAELSAGLGLPRTLAAIGVLPEDLPRVAEAATRDHSSATNPRPCTAADYLALLEAAMT
jgi:alcohol dehydrogenase class IV